MMKRLNRTVGFIVCFAIIIATLVSGQNTVRAAAFFSTEANGKDNIPEYAIGNFLARLNYSQSSLTVTLIPKSSSYEASNIWYTNISNPTQLSQAVAGYPTGPKNSEGNYIVTIPNPQIAVDGTLYLFLATNTGDTGWVKCNVHGMRIDWINDLGLGSIRTVPVINPAWAENGLPDMIYKTDNIKGAVPTNDWLSSILWIPFSEPLYAHPLVYQY